MIKQFLVYFSISMALLNFSSLSYAGSYLLDNYGSPVRDSSGECINYAHSGVNTLQPGCDPMDRVTLLPSSDGSVGAVLVSVNGQNKVIDTAYTGLQVDESGHLEDVSYSPEEIKQRFSALLDLQPQPSSVYVVSFETGSSTQLTPDSDAIIKVMLLDLSKRKAPEIRVTGHTDTVGSTDINDKLSKKRAQTVVGILIAEGIPSDRLEATGRGERELAVQTSDNVDEAANRRVEITVR